MSLDLLTQFRQIAESLLTGVEWTSADAGYCRCPGFDLHPKGSHGKRDCMIRLGGEKPPTIFCVHRSSCTDAVAERNRLMRSAIGKAKWQVERGENPDLPARPVLSSAVVRRANRRRKLADLAERFRRGLPDILKSHRWPVNQIWAQSPADPTPGWRALLDLFAPDDVLWIGDKKESGHPRFAPHFRTSAHWRHGDRPIGPLMSAACWRPGGYQRSAEHIVRARFLVVESDLLTRDQIGAVFRWCHEDRSAPLVLRAVIDTGGKGLHGWFDRPTHPRRLEERVTALRAMGCDPGPMLPSSMSRLPDAWRPERQRHQRLLWIDPGVRG